MFKKVRLLLKGRRVVHPWVAVVPSRVPKPATTKRQRDRSKTANLRKKKKAR